MADLAPADKLALKLYGQTRQVAWSTGTCVRCRKPPVLGTQEDTREYYLSALCPACWQELFPDG